MSDKLGSVGRREGDEGERPKEKENIKEKHLTVTPFRLQLEQPKHTLKKTLNICLEPSEEISPLETQIAGHGSCNDGQRGMFQHKGFVLKPVQASPRGPREVSFYRGLTGSTSQDDLKMLEITARFYGVETVRMTGGEMCEFLVLENITKGFIKPCLMDIKIGAQTFGPDATEEKKAKEAKSYVGTKIPFGFSVLGIISNTNQGHNRLTKAFGRSLNERNLDAILENFLDNLDRKLAVKVAKCFLEKLDIVLDFFFNQLTYHVFASSLLFVYDYENLDNVNFDLCNPVRVKLIDFAHVFPANGVPDNNFLFGLKNLQNLFREFIAEKS